MLPKLKFKTILEIILLHLFFEEGTETNIIWAAQPASNICIRVVSFFFQHSFEFTIV